MYVKKRQIKSKNTRNTIIISKLINFDIINLDKN